MTDEELVRNTLKGDESCFEQIVKKYERLVYSICYRMFNNKEDALDYSQETFVKVYKNMEKAIGKGNFKSWICTIATNTCLDELRKRSKKKTLSLDEQYDTGDNNVKYEVADDAPTPLEELVTKEDNSLLNEAINQLSDDYKSIIVLRDIEGLSYDEIGEILDITIGTVKSRISRARKKLQKLYIDLLQQNKV